MSEQLDIKLFKYLMKKDSGFGYVQIRDFLLKNFKDEKGDRLRMKRFLDHLSSEGYIEVESGKTYGIGLITDAGRKIPREEISYSIRIKSKAVESYKEYKKYNFDKNLRILLAFFSAVAFVLSIYTLKKPSTEQYDELDKKMDSIIKAMSQKTELEKLKYSEKR
ncbi:MAG TPA: hypothetical protein VF985_01450 [Mariniflexile sp.]